MKQDENTVKIKDVIYKVSRKLSAGDCKEVVCPDCGGKLIIERSPVNGHLHVECLGCKFILMQ